jgi:hypothetical protein
VNNNEELKGGGSYTKTEKKPTWTYLDYACFLQRHVYSKGQEAGSVKSPGVETGAGIQRRNLRN